MKKYHLYLTADERRIILHSLIDMKNELIKTGHYTDALDEIIIKLRSLIPDRVTTICLILNYLSKSRARLASGDNVADAISKNITKSYTITCSPNAS